MKSLSDITLSDIMAEDVDIWLKRNNKFGFDIQIEDENGGLLVDEFGVHPYAADSLASFCRQYLSCYDKQEMAA